MKIQITAKVPGADGDVLASCIFDAVVRWDALSVDEPVNDIHARPSDLVQIIFKDTAGLTVWTAPYRTKEKQ